VTVAARREGTPHERAFVLGLRCCVDPLPLAAAAAIENRTPRPHAERRRLYERNEMSAILGAAAIAHFDIRDVARNDIRYGDVPRSDAGNRAAIGGQFGKLSADPRTESRSRGVVPNRADR
jgi:hypothetical protein